MPEAHVTFDGVWKRFRRGQVHDSLRDLVPALTKRLLRGERKNGQLSAKEFWALRDLSFEVRPGQVLGIIGANGAGKSTTLKILNRIMEPSSGRVTVQGRLGALIEVSAGFHPDLTGRQNVFLQGAIMGMRKEEVSRKFDDIVDFSGIADFIDTPVKRYSSGMNARLGFSIAAHLEPEVLIIDEVLAVGDHAFQGRAFGRIKDMAKAGAPVVLVSHQLDRIAELCTNVILLEKGAVRKAGSAHECIVEYMHSASAVTSNDRFGDTGITFGDIVAPKGFVVYSGESFEFSVSGAAKSAAEMHAWTPIFRVINTQTGEHLQAVTGRERGVSLNREERFRWDIQLQMNVPPGMYFVEVGIWDPELQADVVRGPRVQVEVLERLRFWGSVQFNTQWAASVDR